MPETDAYTPPGQAAIGQILNLDRYSLHDLKGPRGRALVADCLASLAETGSYSLPGVMNPAAIEAALGEISPLMADQAFLHRQSHNIYFLKNGNQLPSDHPALARQETSNRVLACDQLQGTVIRRVYEWPALAAFIAATLGKDQLFPMADPLARLNVMSYGKGQGIGWHFDRAVFTVTLLLQAPERGGQFLYRRNLRSETDPNHDGVARLLRGEDQEVRRLPLEPGTLNLFAGRYAAHRVTEVEGDRQRLIAVLSFMERPDVVFSADDRRQFYGRDG